VQSIHTLNPSTKARCGHMWQVWYSLYPTLQFRYLTFRSPFTHSTTLMTAAYKPFIIITSATVLHRTLLRVAAGDCTDTVISVHKLFTYNAKSTNRRRRSYYSASLFLYFTLDVMSVPAPSDCITSLFNSRPGT